MDAHSFFYMTSSLSTNVSSAGWNSFW